MSRSSSLDPEDFRALHDSLFDALSPGAASPNYYHFRQDQDERFRTQTTRDRPQREQKTIAFSLQQGTALRSLRLQNRALFVELFSSFL